MSEKVRVRPSKVKTRSVTITAGQTASSAFRLNGPVVGISYPSATYTPTTLTISVSGTNGGTYHLLGATLGGVTAPSITIGDSQATFHPCEPSFTAGWKWAKLNINATNGTDITFTVYEAV